VADGALRGDPPIARTSLGEFRDREFARRFRTRAGAPVAPEVQVGFVFGPRALRGLRERVVPVVVASGPGTQRLQARRFRDGAAVARFLVGELNRSLHRAGVDARFRVGAVSRLTADETRPFGAHPGPWTDDLFAGRVRSRGRALPLECWAAARAVNCALLLLDWGMGRARLEGGELAGLAPRPATPGRGGLVFHPVAVADLRCALAAHSAAHELGHLLGCSHEDAFNPCASTARAFVASGGERFGVMAAARRDEGGRRLEWSRPTADAGTWDLGDARHDEASWLRVAMPQLGQQRFRCAEQCAGACAEVRRPRR
jgi:hypothetical protein